MWFNANDITINKNKIICVNNLKGLVLPHAGTEYTGHILSNTLRFKPKKFFNKVLILYLPANLIENVKDGDENKSYFHEYYVPWQSLSLVMKKYWDMKSIAKPENFIGYNINSNDQFPDIDFKKTLIVVSADFSHHLPMAEAIEKENCAAHSLMQNFYNPTCTQVVDDLKTFKYLYNKDDFKKLNLQLQWVGRTRSSGEKGVGYLSFLMRNKPNPNKKHPQGLFVTAYDTNMNQRECLGQWYSEKDKWNIDKEKNLIEDVIQQGSTTSRLTGGRDINVPIKHYTLTYLYKQPRTYISCGNRKTNKKNKSNKSNKSKYMKNKRTRNQRNLKKDTKATRVEFIRGWHGIKHKAFYLPDVMLENTFNNGEWITPNDKIWPQEFKFNMTETLEKLNIKAGGEYNKNAHEIYDLYYTSAEHRQRDINNIIGYINTIETSNINDI